MNSQEGRRPLKVRSAPAAQRFARWLSQQNVTPNQISLGSILFAAQAAVCLGFLGHAPASLVWVLAVLAAMGIQGRLLCNLFDGMVAVEGGKGTASGELFNDLPDRIADPLILIAAGYGAASIPGATALGWFAALGAVGTAYVRNLAVAVGAPADFGGPMAKQHRMALMTGACLVAAIEPLLHLRGMAMVASLGVIGVGCIMTIARRVFRAYRFLEGEALV